MLLHWVELAHEAGLGVEARYNTSNGRLTIRVADIAIGEGQQFVVANLPPQEEEQGDNS